MSSVLKALKKAEQDGSLYARNPDLKSNVQRILNSKNWNQRKKRVLTPQKTLLLSAVVIAFAGLIFFTLIPRKTPDLNLEKQIHQPSVAQPSVSQPAVTVQNPRTPPAPQPEPGIKPAPKVDNRAPNTMDYPEQPSVTTQTSLPETDIMEAKNLETEDMANTEEPDIGMETNVHDPKEDDDTDIEQIEDDSIIIQAISWAAVPEERIAVINNNIVSEKEMISDYQVIQIRKDEVILGRAGEKFSLKFKYR